MDTDKLITEKVKLINEARALHEKETFDKLDSEQFDKIMNRVEEVNHTLKREESIKNFTPEKVKTKFIEAATSNLSVYDHRKTDDYNRAFDSLLRTGVNGLTPEFKNVLQIGTTTAGGFLVPTLLESMIIDGLHDLDPLRQMCTVIQTSNNSNIPFSVVDGAASWVAEGVAVTPTEPTFGQRSLGAFKMMKLTRLSKELLADNAVDLLAFLARSFSRSFADLETAAFLTGAAAGRPVGIITSANMQTQAAAVAGAISVDDIFNLEFKVARPYRAKGSFLMADATYKALSLLKDTAGQYYLRPSLSAGGADTLDGKPIYISNFMPAIGAGLRSVAFGDFSYVTIADRLNRELMVLTENYATTFEVGYLAAQRVDIISTFDAATAVLLHP